MRLPALNLATTLPSSSAPLVLVLGLLLPVMGFARDATEAPRAQPPERSELQSAFDDYWSAETDWEQGHAAAAILSLDAPYDSLRQRLSRGRPYSAEVTRGKRVRVRMDDRGRAFGYIVLVPENYDPSRRYPTRVVLHGSIQRAAWEEPGSWWQRTDPFVSEHWFTVFPAAWQDALWWRFVQVENLGEILRELRRRYNLDEDRVHLMGLSDGGTGTFFHALKNTTPWASFCPFIGHPNVLNHDASRADGQFYAVNLRNKPLWVANGLEDPLYPAGEVSLYLDLFRRAGARIIYRPQEGGHNVRWWPREAAEIRAFQDQSPRSALPDSLVWESDRVDRYARAHWLRILELGTVPGESELPDYNTLHLPEGFDPREARAFPRERGSGRVELACEGNLIEARTRGVRRFALLISGDQFDLDQPLRVEVNGKPAFEGQLERDPDTLLRWAILDEDRSMLFDAELEIEVPGAD